MKKALFIIFIFPSLVLSQTSGYSTFYHQRASLFEELSVENEDVVFLGNSITNGGEWAELFNDNHIKNRGISGDVCMGVYDRLDAVLKGNPRKIFLMIGINDIARNTTADTIVLQTEMILDKIISTCPTTEVYLQSILPVTDHYGMFAGHTKHWQMIRPLNDELMKLSKSKNITFIDLYSHFVEPDSDKMDIGFTNDGLHLMGKGYIKWAKIIQPYIIK